MSGSRRTSMAGAAPIPVSEIESYCRLYQIHDVEFVDLLVERIQFLDGVYLDHLAKEAEKKTKK